MNEAGTPYVFVGSKEGQLRAYRMSEADGSLTLAGSHKLSGLSFFAVASPVAVSGAMRTVFVSGKSSLSALSYDATTGEFTPGPATVTSGGGTHVATDENGASVMLAHYSENLLSYFTYRADGGFSVEEVLSPGNNAHQVRERGGRVYVPCLGSDHIAQYDLVVGATNTQLVASAAASAPSAGGPRHMAFHPSVPVAYVLTELSSQIHVYDLEPSGALTQRNASSAYTHEDGEYHWSSDIQLRPDGAFVYAVNRNPSEIVQFKVLPDSSLTRVSSEALVGEVRSFAMDPQGVFLQVGNKEGILQTFCVDELTGCLSKGPSLSGLGSIHHTEIHYLPVP